MNACDNKLKSALVEAMRLDNARLEEELQHDEPHVFSPHFERRMEKLIKVQRSKAKVRNCFRYIAAAVLVLFLTGGILFIGSEDLNASALSIDILEWLDEFFTVGRDVSTEKEPDTLFDENQIGYLPEGFVKVEEGRTFSHVHFKYENELGDTIAIRISKSIGETVIDSEDVIKEVLISEQGYEYTKTYKEEIGHEIYIWKDDNDIFYYLSGNVDSNEMLKIMNHISCGE